MYVYSSRDRKSYPHYEHFKTFYGQRACEEPAVIIDNDTSTGEAGGCLVPKGKAAQKNSKILEAFINDTNERWAKLDERGEKKMKRQENHRNIDGKTIGRPQKIANLWCIV